jgi:RNA polymerase sigma factor (sigma-70 family)
MSPTLLQSVVRVADARTPDADLLERFRLNRDEQAFEELVRRHGPLVWAVCRHLLPHHADAEDAFQAVFLALVRGASSIRAGQALPAWLHGTAVRVAIKARRSAVRRRQREHRAAVPERHRPVPDESWTALMTAVHEEIGQLPEGERTAFVLCDLEGVRQPDAAARLGWPLGTLSGRLCKARQRLVDQLTRRGIAPAILALGGFAGSAGTVPASLLEQVSSFSTASAAGIPSTVATLARGLVEGTTMRTKMLAATILVAGAFSLSGGALVLSQADAQSGAGGSGAPPGVSPDGAGRPPRAGFGGGDSSFGRGAASGQSGTTDDGPASFPAQNRGGSGFSGFASSGPAAWDYKFLHIDGEQKEFERVITQNGRDGWEYCESQRMNDGKRDVLVLVFKKPRGARGAMGGGGMGSVGGMSSMLGAGGFGGGMPMQPFPGGGLGGFPGMEPGFPGGSGASARFTAGDIEARTHRLKTTNATELARSIEKALPKAKTLKVVPEPTSNMIIIVADTATMKDVLRIIEEHEGKEAPSAGGGTRTGSSGGGSRPPAGGGGGAPGRPGVRGGEGPDAPLRPGAGAPGGIGPMRGALPPRGAGELKVFVLKHAKAQELVPVLDRLFRSAEFTAETRTNQLITRGDAETLMEIAALLERLDVDLPRR